MKYFLFIIISWSMTSAEEQDICIRGHIHVKSTFKAPHAHKWSEMVVDTENNILYYTSSRNSINSIRYLTLPDVRGNVLFDIKNPWKLSVDRFTSYLYIVGNNDSTTDVNLYKYDKDSKDISNIAENITHISLYRLYAIKNQLYWIDGDLTVYRYSKGKIGKHNIKMQAYAEDAEGTMYFIKENDEQSVYRVRKGEKTQQRFVTKDSVTDFITDTEGKVYVAGKHTLKLYEISEEEGKLVQASDVLPSYPNNFHFDQANDLIWIEGQHLCGKYTKTLKPCGYKN